jgi:hypothetical protein
VLITGIIALSMLPFFFGLLITGPVIGHATWHAYRAVVPAQEDQEAPMTATDGDGGLSLTAVAGDDTQR